MVTNNTIVIYHDLLKGGALHLQEEIAKSLKSKKYKVIIFSPNKRYFKKKRKIINIFSYLYYSIISLAYENYQIAKKINTLKPKATLVFPSINTQAPSILFFLNSKNTYYFFTESKREFYENTSFDHFSVKNTLSRLLLFPMKIMDLVATKYVKKILTISSYSQTLLLNIYKKKALEIIRPGQKNIKPIKRYLNLDGNFITIGLLAKPKGHHFTIQQFEQSKFSKTKKLIIIGKNSHESSLIKKMINNKNIILKTTVNEKEKQRLLSKSYAYFANQENEPYGISTLEAANSGLLIIGKNSGGTPEIVQNGNNGVLYPSNLKTAVKVLDEIYEKPHISIHQTCIIDWNFVTSQLINVIQNR